MSVWFNFATTRGDIIAQLPEYPNAKKVEDLADAGLPELIVVQYPISPKATPQIIKRCRACQNTEDLTEVEEAELASATVGGPDPDIKCSACGSNKVTPDTDKSRLKVEFTNPGTLFDTNKMLIGRNQIAHISLVSEVEAVESAASECYNVQLMSELTAGSGLIVE